MGAAIFPTALTSFISEPVGLRRPRSIPRPLRLDAKGPDLLQRRNPDLRLRRHYRFLIIRMGKGRPVFRGMHRGVARKRDLEWGWRMGTGQQDGSGGTGAGRIKGARRGKKADS
jgi:hypothetical protein